MSIQTIESMVNWVELNISHDPNLIAMSKHVGYSSYYCSSKFHEFVGMSFKTYVMKRKLYHAASDLSQSSDKIIDIAVRYGFSSHEAFTRSFKREFSLSPSMYRRNQPAINTCQMPSF